MTRRMNLDDLRMEVLLADLPDFIPTAPEPETKICIGCHERCTFSELDLAVWYGTCSYTGRNVKKDNLLNIYISA